MGNVRLQMDGLSELRAALRRLPEELTAEADAIIQAQAGYAQQQIVAAYPQGPTGNLKHGVTVNKESSRFGVRAIVRSRARHSHLFEFGTAPRRTKKGANRGSMPKAPESERMIPIVVRRRRAMVQALIELVRKAGFSVETQA